MTKKLRFISRFISVFNIVFPILIFQNPLYAIIEASVDETRVSVIRMDDLERSIYYNTSPRVLDYSFDYPMGNYPTSFSPNMQYALIDPIPPNTNSLVQLAFDIYYRGERIRRVMRREIIDEHRKTSETRFCEITNQSFRGHLIYRWRVWDFTDTELSIATDEGRIIVIDLETTEIINKIYYHELEYGSRPITQSISTTSSYEWQRTRNVFELVLFSIIVTIGVMVLFSIILVIIEQILYYGSFEK